MALLDPLFRFLGSLSQRLDNIVEAIFNPTVGDEQASDALAGALEDATAVDEVAEVVVDLVEEGIIDDLEQAGEITPENVEELADGVEGGATAVLLGLGLAGSAVEAASLGQVDQQQEYITQAIAGLGVDDVTGTEMEARLEEGIKPAQEARAAKEHRAKFVSLQDAVEVLARAKSGDEGWLRGDNVDDRWAEAVGSAEPENPENLIEEWGIRDDNLEILERAALQIPEIEELIETPMQLGVIPNDEVVDEVLQLSGSPESVKDLFRETISNADRSADLWEQRTVADELVAQLDKLVLDGELTPDEAAARVPDELEPAKPALRDRWALLADIPGAAPTRSQIENGFTRGLIGLDRYLELLGRVDVDPEAHPYVPQEAILAELDGDLRTAVGLGLIEQGQYTEYARLAGLDEETVSRLLQGEDLDDIASSRLQEQADQQAFPVDVVSGIGESRRATLEAAGIETVGQLAQATPEALLEVLDVSESTAQTFIDRAAQLTG